MSPVTLAIVMVPAAAAAAAASALGQVRPDCTTALGQVRPGGKQAHPWGKTGAWQARREGRPPDPRTPQCAGATTLICTSPNLWPFC